MKRKIVQRVLDFFTGSKSVEEHFDWQKILGGVSEGMTQVFGEERVTRTNRYNHRDIDFTVRQIVHPSFSEYHSSTIYGIVLPAYKNMEVNQCVLEDLFGGLVRPLNLARGSRSPCSFESFRGGFVPVLSERNPMAALSKSRRLIDCYVDNIEAFEEGLAEIDRIYPTTDEERDLVIRNNLDGLFTYRSRF